MAREKSLHDQLDVLRQAVGHEGTKKREIGVALDAARAKVEDAGRAITDAYTAEDGRLAARQRKVLEAAETELADLHHREAAAAQRVERAQHEAATFTQERGRDLLSEREGPARTIAAELTDAVRNTLRLADAYLMERQTQDQLIAAVPGATPRHDGPPASHPWEAELKALDRAVGEHPDLPAPLPRWAGLDQRQRLDDINRREQLRRRSRRSAEEQAELDRINREQGLPAPTMTTAG